MELELFFSAGLIFVLRVGNAPISMIHPVFIASKRHPRKHLA